MSDHDAAPVPRRLKLLTLLCKCLEYVLKFIIAYFNKDIADGTLQADPSCQSKIDFKNNIADLLGKLTALLARQQGDRDPFVGCKAFILKSFCSTLVDLSTIFDPTELASIVDNVIKAIPLTSICKLSLYKLKLST